jgi:hypothetical protein
VPAAGADVSPRRFCVPHPPALGSLKFAAFQLPQISSTLAPTMSHRCAEVLQYYLL